MRIENTVLNCFTDIQAPKKKPENPDEGVLRHFLEDTVGILIYGSLAADFPDIGITGIRKLLKKYKESHCEPCCGAGLRGRPLRSRSTDRGGLSIRRSIRKPPGNGFPGAGRY